MNNKRNLSILIILALVLMSCSLLPQAATAEPKGVTPTAEATIIIITATPEATVIPPTETPAPTPTAMPVEMPDYSSTSYVDDLSTPASLIYSFVNAINRFEYLRAYSYWPNGADILGSLDAFTAGYDNVASETVTLGAITSEGAAGSEYFTVPAALTDTLKDGGTTKYAVCYVLRLPQPGNYGEPPVQPMHFDSYTKLAVDATISDDLVVAAACNTSGLPAAAPAISDVADVSSANYLDNRSGPVEVVSSLINAVNRKEFARAYSYMQDPTITFANFSGSYSDLLMITVAYGTITSDAGAGQLYYKLPLVEYVSHTNNTQHIYVGCYTLHLANPGMQGALPFEPLGITDSNFTEYPVGTDVAPLLAAACD